MSVTGVNCIHGYHGTTQLNAEQILKSNIFIESRKNNEWLGTGVYFFQYKNHAQWWISHNRFKGKDTRILKAKLEFEDSQLLDLDDPKKLEDLEAIVKHMVDIANSAGDDTSAKFTDQQKWCFACNAYRALNPEIGIIIYTFHTSKLYKNSNFKENQRQICVSHSPIITKIEIA